MIMKNIIVCDEKFEMPFQGISVEMIYDMGDTLSSDELVDVVRDSGAEGINFFGDALHDRLPELMELMLLLSTDGIKIMITTDDELTAFQQKIGLECARLKGMFLGEDGDTVLTNDPMMFSAIGVAMLDYHCTHNDLFICTGMYDETRLVEDRVHFGVELPCDTISIHRFVKAEVDGDVSDKDDEEIEE